MTNITGYLPPLLDIIISLPLIWGFYRGFTKGFLIEICTFFALVLAITGGFHFIYLGTEHIKNNFNINTVLLPFISFIIVAILIFLLVLLLGKLLNKLIKVSSLNIFNKITGAIFGFLKYEFILSVFIWLFNQIGIIPTEWKSDSVLYLYAEPFAPELIEWLSFLIPWFKDTVFLIEKMFNEIQKQQIIV